MLGRCSEYLFLCPECQFGTKPVSKINEQGRMDFSPEKCINLDEIMKIFDSRMHTGNHCICGRFLVSAQESVSQ